MSSQYTDAEAVQVATERARTLCVDSLLVALYGAARLTGTLEGEAQVRQQMLAEVYGAEVRHRLK